MRTLFTATAALFAVVAFTVAGGTGAAFGAQDVGEADAIETSAGMKATSAASTLGLSTSLTVGVAPAQVTLVATVGGTALKGDITFKSGIVTIAVATLNKNAATVTVKLPAAIHSLTAVYAAPAGDIVSPPAIVVVDNDGLACS